VLRTTHHAPFVPHVTPLPAEQTSAVALADSYYATIAEEDPKIHAWLALSRERATAQAYRIDEQAKSGDLANEEALPLAGVPIGIKMCW